MGIPRILGFAGVAGVGKDKAGDAVQKEFGHEPTAVADLLKDIAARCYDVDVGLLDDARALLTAGGKLTRSQEAKLSKVRRALWDIGDAMKTVDPDCLIRGAMRFADMSAPLRKDKPLPKSCVVEGSVVKPRVVFTDIRNPNEVQWIRQRGGEVFRLVGPSLWGKEPTGDDRLGDLQLESIDVSAAAEASIVLLRSGAQNPYAPFERRVIEWLVSRFGLDDEQAEHEEVDIDFSEGDNPATSE